MMAPTMIGARLSDRARSWLLFAIVSNVTMSLMAVWALYAATHVQTRYIAAEPGTSVTVAGANYQLIKLTRSEVVVSDGDKYPSYANTSWVVAVLEITLEHKIEYPLCGATLIAAGNRSWETWNGDNASFYGRPLSPDCSELKPDKPYRFEQIYQIPNSYVDQIYGVAVNDNSDASPVPVLRI